MLAKPIPLDRVRDMFEFDCDVGVLIHKERNHPVSWNAQFAGKEAGSKNNDGRFSVMIDGKRYLRSRVIFALKTNKFVFGTIDHINGNSSDDRFCNLREVTQTINNCNKRRMKNNTTGTNGVFLMPNGRYRARLSQKHLGTFDTIEEAAIARKRAEAGLGFTDRHGAIS